MKLVQVFLNLNSADGARMAVDCFFAFISQLSREEANLLKMGHVDHIWNFILSFGKHPAASNPEWFETFVSLFRQMDPSVQCQFVLHLEDTIQSLPQLETFYRSLCVALTDCKIYSVSTERIVEMIQLYVRLGNRELLQAFLFLITGGFDAVSYSSTLGEKEKQRIGRMATDPVVIQLARRSALGQLVFNELTNCMFSDLYRDDGKTLSAYLNLVLAVEFSPSDDPFPPEDPTRFAMLQSMASKLDIVPLMEVLRNVLDTWQRLRPRFKDTGVVQMMSQLLLSRLVNEEMSAVVLETIAATPMLIDVLNMSGSLVKTIVTKIQPESGSKYRKLVDRIKKHIKPSVGRRSSKRH